MKTTSTALGLAILAALLVTACDRTPTGVISKDQIDGIGPSEHTGGLADIRVDHENCGGFIPESPGGCPGNDDD